MQQPTKLRRKQSLKTKFWDRIVKPFIPKRAPKANTLPHGDISHCLTSLSRQCDIVEITIRLKALEQRVKTGLALAALKQV